MIKGKVLFWQEGIDGLRDETDLITGLVLQLSIWAEGFQINGWKVSTFSNKPTKRKDLDYIKFPSFKFGNIILAPLVCFYLIKRIRPQVIISRGARRNHIWISLWSKVMRIKHVHMLASDSDLDFGNELIDHIWDRKLYQMGMRFTKLFVVQNEMQDKKLNLLFKGINYTQIPNVWPQIISNNYLERKSILWVSNFRTLKRPEWFFKIAEAFPNYNFIMVGGALDKNFYEQCEIESHNIPNLQFKGPLKLSDVNILFNQTKLFLCTSTIEGFPNTFLQAWSNKIPVLTSFDPSDIVAKLKLGLVCNSIDSFVDGIKKFENINYYESIQKNITEYFNKNHDVNKMYLKLISTLLT